MRMVSTVTMLILFVAAPAICAAQQGAAEKPWVVKAAAQRITGKVTAVDANAKTFTVVSEGKTLTIGAGNLRSLPKVGDIVDITYTVTPDGTLNASNLNLAKSNVN